MHSCGNVAGQQPSAGRCSGPFSLSCCRAILLSSPEGRAHTAAAWQLGEPDRSPAPHVSAGPEVEAPHSPLLECPSDVLSRGLPRNCNEARFAVVVRRTLLRSQPSLQPQQRSRPPQPSDGVPARHRSRAALLVIYKDSSHRPGGHPADRHGPHCSCHSFRMIATRWCSEKYIGAGCELARAQRMVCWV